MEGFVQRWKTLINGMEPNDELRRALWYVAYNLTSLLSQPIALSSVQVRNVSHTDLTSTANLPNELLFGIYLLINDDLPGQAILMLPASDARRICDAMNNQQVGSTQQIGALERSTIGELGNVALSAFLNTVAQPDWGHLHPSPPALMLDEPKTLLESVVSSIATSQEDLIIIDALLENARKTISMRLWLIPNPSLKMALEPAEALGN